MCDSDRPAIDLYTLLERVEATFPAAAIDVVVDELAAQVGAHAVPFLIAEFSGRALVRLAYRHPASPARAAKATSRARLCRCPHGVPTRAPHPTDRRGVDEKLEYVTGRQAPVCAAARPDDSTQRRAVRIVPPVRPGPGVGR